MGQNPLLLTEETFERIDEGRASVLAQATARLCACAFASRTAHAAGLRITLDGQLGAGKTTFVRYFLRALGITGRIKSPSFSVVESYVSPQGIALHHFDFYRQSDPFAWQGGGLRDLMAEPAISLIEWPQKASGLPPAHIQLAIDWEKDALADAPRRLHVLLFDCHDGIALAPHLAQWRKDASAQENTSRT